VVEVVVEEPLLVVVEAAVALPLLAEAVVVLPLLAEVAAVVES
jgi:hypothetical protein